MITFYLYGHHLLLNICCNLCLIGFNLSEIISSLIKSHSIFHTVSVTLQVFKIFLKLSKLQSKSHPVIVIGSISLVPFLCHTFIIVPLLLFLSSKNMVLPNVGVWGINAPSVFKIEAMLVSWPLNTLYFCPEEGVWRIFSKWFMIVSNHSPVATESNL